MTGLVGCHCFTRQSLFPVIEGRDDDWTYITMDERFSRTFKDFDQHSGVPIPDKDIVRHLVARTAHHVLAITRKPNGVPWCPVDQVLEPVNGVQDACKWGYLECANGAVGSRDDHVAKRSAPLSCMSVADALSSERLTARLRRMRSA